MLRSPTTLLLCLAFAALPACGPDRAGGDSTKPSPALAAPQGGAPGAPASTRTPQDAPSAAPLGKGPLAFTPPAGWVVEPTTSGMRAAQYRLPAQEGEGQDTTVVVFFFGAAGGGGFEANVARWASQFEQPDGAPTMERARETSRSVNGMALREVALEGTYVAETFPGSGQRVREEGWALRGAMVEAPTGPYYIRLLGPRAGVERAEPSFRTFLGDLRPAN